MLKFAEFNTNNILVLPSVDSTNTYAHLLLANGQYQHGMVIQAHYQTSGRGQRGNDWYSDADQNLLMSIIIEHQNSRLESQFVLNMAVCLAIAECVYRFNGNKICSVKWSNDVYIDDHKIAGILIENIIKGANWSHSIIGIGVNINTMFFDDKLTNATSIYKQLGRLIDINMFRNEMIHCINEYLIWAKTDEYTIIEKYNASLYKKNQLQMFTHNQQIINREIKGVNASGQIILGNKNVEEVYNFGEIKQLVGGLN
jgi:BirA family transcriptional regulator, biotin operon repressor / biotin---[acetyl-CoA-carboxylase] ligase